MDIGQTVYSYNALISSAISMIESLCVLCNKKDNNYGEEMNISLFIMCAYVTKNVHSVC